MKIPRQILDVINKEETIQLVRLYGTDLYKAYITKLKKKYANLYNFLDEEIEDPREGA